MTKLTEIAKEMGRDTLDVSRKVGRFSWNLTQNVIEHGFTPFIFPTWHRRVIDKKYSHASSDKLSTKLATDRYGHIRFFEGLAVRGEWLGSFVVNVDKVEDLKYLTIPLATNLASAVYERGRNVCKRVEERKI